MRLERAKRKAPVRPAEDIILFVVGEMRLAIAAHAVDEIRNVDGLKLIAEHSRGKLGKVKHTLVREKTGTGIPYFVVDAGSHYGLLDTKPSRVMVLRNCPAAVLVDNIEKMTQINAVTKLPPAFTGAECEWYRGLAVVDQQVVPLVEPSSFLSKGEIAVLQAQTTARSAVAGGVSA